MFKRFPIAMESFGSLKDFYEDFYKDEHNNPVLSELREKLEANKGDYSKLTSAEYNDCKAALVKEYTPKLSAKINMEQGMDFGNDAISKLVETAINEWESANMKQPNIVPIASPEIAEQPAKSRRELMTESAKLALAAVPPMPIATMPPTRI